MQWNGLGDTTKTTAPAPDLERRLSRREKKELKKREKEAQRREAANKENIAKRLYEAAPDSSFTRSISNPEMVMRRRRQVKLERKLQQIRTSDDGPNSGAHSSSVNGLSALLHIVYVICILHPVLIRLI